MPRRFSATSEYQLAYPLPGTQHLMRKLWRAHARNAWAYLLQFSSVQFRSPPYLIYMHTARTSHRVPDCTTHRVHSQARG